jgi:hypothetical protein
VKDVKLKVTKEERKVNIINIDLNMRGKQKKHSDIRKIRKEKTRTTKMAKNMKVQGILEKKTYKREKRQRQKN